MPLDRAGVLAVGLLAAAHVFAGAATAQPAPETCPVVVDNTTLQADCVGPMVIAGDNLNVNLGAHQVICPDHATSGIVIYLRVRVHVENGHVHGCSIGIDVLGPLPQGPTMHTFTNLHVDGNGTGIRMKAADENDISASTIVDNQLFGIEMDHSQLNRIHSGTVVGENAINVHMVESHFTEIASSTIGPGEEGIRIVSGNNAAIHGNTIAGNVRFGISLGSNAHMTVVEGNEIARNGQGIAGSMAQANIIRGNTVHDNVAEGILIGGPVTDPPFSTLWQVYGNHVVRNSVGIRVGPLATENTIEANTARDNRVFDLQDDNPACDANVWRNNNDVTQNQPCID